MKNYVLMQKQTGLTISMVPISGNSYGALEDALVFNDGNPRIKGLLSSGSKIHKAVEVEVINVLKECDISKTFVVLLNDNTYMHDTMVCLSLQDAKVFSETSNLTKDLMFFERISRCIIIPVEVTRQIRIV